MFVPICRFCCIQPCDFPESLSQPRCSCRSAGSVAYRRDRVGGRIDAIIDEPFHKDVVPFRLRNLQIRFCFYEEKSDDDEYDKQQLPMLEGRKIMFEGRTLTPFEHLVFV